jgi:hypothetical protein
MRAKASAEEAAIYGQCILQLTLNSVDVIGWA